MVHTPTTIQPEPKEKATISSGDIAAISRLFSAGVIQEMARWGKSPQFTRLAHEGKLFQLLPNSARVSDSYDVAYSHLRKKANRHEYVYKSALTQNVLLGKHSLRTAAMLTEFRAENCKADLVILNGTATAYEIKSERDSLARLERQILAYRRVFGSVYVIAGENHIRSIMSDIPKDVGIMSLTSRHHISTVRKAENLPERTQPSAIFESLQLREAKQILELNGVKIPTVPNTALYSTLRDLFSNLPPSVAHAGMVSTLRKTRNLEPLLHLIGQLPRALHSAALTIPMRSDDHSRLLQATNTSMADARQW